MSNILRYREYVAEPDHFVHYWDQKDGRGSGYGFDCNEDGSIDLDQLEGIGLENAVKCLAGTMPDMVDKGVTRYERGYWKPTVIKCDCGKEVELYSSWYNTCDCGRGYNASGQELSHPSQWGEETGERFGDDGGYIGGGEDE